MVFIAVIMDFATGKVSNRLIVVGLIVGLVLQIVFGGKENIDNAFIGAIVPIIVLILVFIIGGIGAGDIKLFSVIGVFLGPRGVFICIIVAIVIGAIISLGKILMNRNFYIYFSNLFNYVSTLNQTNKIQLYKREKYNTIHFTLPILLSVLIYMGGFI